MNLKKILIATAVVGASILPVFAFATGTYITLPEGFATSVLAYAGGMFTDLNVLILLVIGLPLAFWVIRKVIGLVRAR